MSEHKIAKVHSKPHIDEKQIVTAPARNALLLLNFIFII